MNNKKKALRKLLEKFTQKTKDSEKWYNNLISISKYLLLLSWVANQVGIDIYNTVTDYFNIYKKIIKKFTLSCKQ